MRKIFTRIFSIFLRVGITVILLIYLFKQVDHENLFEIISHARIGWVIAAFLIFFSAYVAAVARWEMLIRAINIRIPLSRLIVSFAGGNFFNLFLPSTIGGDLVRSIDLARHTKKPREVVATVLLDRLSGYVGLAALMILALCFGWRLIEDPSVFIAAALIIALLVVILMVLFNQFVYSWLNRLLAAPNAGKVRESIKKLHEELHIFRGHKKVLAQNLFYSLLIQGLSPLAFYCLAVSFGLKVPLTYFFVFLPIVAAITMLPISIGGLGLRDATIIYFFAKAGVVKDMAFAMSLINFFFIVVVAGIGGLIYIFGMRRVFVYTS